MTILTYLNLFFIVLIFHFCSDNYSAETRDSIVNEFSSNKRVNVKCCGLRFESA